MFDDIFLHKKINPSKLIAYGFKKDQNTYKYSVNIMNGYFTLHVAIDGNGAVETSLTETDSGEEYILYKTNVSGTFVGDVRAVIENVLRDISEKCCDMCVFKSEQAVLLIDYVQRKYGDAPEFLWEKFPDNAIWRRKDNGKWYGTIFTVQKCKLGIDSKEVAEVADLKSTPDVLEDLIDNKKYFPGWHMNKKHWYTVILDGSVPYEELCLRIDMSYQAAKH